ncbi:MFS transporter [Actinospica durhamensis]|uniref:MFS transporter n=1 Tax=Actinospica durhamensis TaxID=1508375 RepID=A0A941ERV7_9ACTN|nr:MFS transporter [Actinospica durhamensis]MBR7835941.1 MFS transporter [Actinospica durhamensis]
MTATTLSTGSAPRQAFERMSQALAGRDFRIWFLGQLTSASGGLAQGVALSWLILQTTGNALWLTALTACTFGPTLLFGAWAGALVDRHDRRKLLLITQGVLLAVGLSFSLLSALGGLRLWVMLALTACSGLVGAVDAPARQVFVVDLVGQDAVASAVGLWEVAINGSRVLGPGAAGALLALSGPTLCFLVNGLSYLAPLLVLIRLRPVGAQGPDAVPAARRPRVRAREGLAYARRSPIIRALLPMSAASGLIFSMSLSLPTLASRTLHLGGGGYGALMAAFGIGGLPGALMAASAPVPTPPRVRRLALATVVAILVTAWAPDDALAFAGMAAAGLTSIWFIASANTLAQLRSDPAMRGRVMSLWGMAMTGTLPLTGLAVTAIAQHIGAREGFSVSAVALTAAVLAGWRALGESGAPGVSAVSVEGRAL